MRKFPLFCMKGKKANKKRIAPKLGQILSAHGRQRMQSRRRTMGTPTRGTAQTGPKSGSLGQPRGEIRPVRTTHSLVIAVCNVPGTLFCEALARKRPFCAIGTNKGKRGTGGRQPNSADRRTKPFPQFQCQSLPFPCPLSPRSWPPNFCAHLTGMCTRRKGTCWNW